jgi:hypothetical protein
MRPEDIDNLFRQSLDDHATPPPPPDALWARLEQTQQQASDERLDTLFRTGLGQHATPPPRELWERLEDEHLRPRPQRVAAAWWPRALAAVVALLLVAGSVGLWTNGRLGGSGRVTEVAASRPARQLPKAQPSANTQTSVAPNAPVGAPTAAGALAVGNGVTSAEAASQKINKSQATPAAVPASTPSNATVVAVAAPARRQSPARRAASSQPAAVAQATTRARTARAADEQPKPEAPTNAMVAAASNQPQAPAPAVASTEVVVVDVKPGGAEPATHAAAALGQVAAAGGDADEQEPRRLGGRLLQQAGRLVRGEKLSLAELTGLPENVTVHAQVGSRTLTKSIQL